MKYMRAIGLLASLFFSGVVFAYDTNVGKIVEVYVTTDGAMAFRLDHPLAIANTCQGYSDWVGIAATSSQTVKASVLLAKSMGSQVVVVSSGCVPSNPTWIALVVMTVEQ